MISRAILDRSARANFSEVNHLHKPIGRVVYERLTSADLSQIAPENLCDYELIIYQQNYDCFLLQLFLFRDMSHWLGRLPLPYCLLLFLC